MKAKLFGAALLTVVGSTSANADTTYLYTGGLFDHIDIGDNPSWGGANPFFADRAADAATFGANITGSLTFNFDSTGVTGTICLSLGGCSGPFSHPTTIAGDLIAKSFVAGEHSLTGVLSGSFVTFTGGAITEWAFGGVTPCPRSLAAIGSCNWQTATPGGILIGQDKLYGIGLSYYPAFWSGPNGTWIAAVPGPVMGAGLPGLMIAGVGLLAWWRRKRRG